MFHHSNIPIATGVLGVEAWFFGCPNVRPGPASCWHGTAHDRMPEAGVSGRLFVRSEADLTFPVVENFLRVLAAYAVLDRHLGGRDWIVGAGPTIADFACCGYLYYPEPFGFDRADWPGIDLDRTRIRPGG